MCVISVTTLTAEIVTTSRFALTWSFVQASSKISTKVKRCLSPLEACTAPSGILKATPQGRGFQDRSSLGPSGPVSKAYHVFRNGDLPSTSERQPKTTAIAYNVWGAPEQLKVGASQSWCWAFSKWPIALRESTVGL